MPSCVKRLLRDRLLTRAHLGMLPDGGRFEVTDSNATATCTDTWKSEAVLSILAVARWHCHI